MIRVIFIHIGMILKTKDIFLRATRWRLPNDLTRLFLGRLAENYFFISTTKYTYVHSFVIMSFVESGWKKMPVLIIFLTRQCINSPYKSHKKWFEDNKIGQRPNLNPTANVCGIIVLKMYLKNFRIVQYNWKAELKSAICEGVIYHLDKFETLRTLYQNAALKLLHAKLA